MTEVLRQLGQAKDELTGLHRQISERLDSASVTSTASPEQRVDSLRKTGAITSEEITQWSAQYKTLLTAHKTSQLVLARLAPSIEYLRTGEQHCKTTAAYVRAINDEGLAKHFARQYLAFQVINKNIQTDLDTTAESQRSLQPQFTAALSALVSASIQANPDTRWVALGRESIREIRLRELSALWTSPFEEEVLHGFDIPLAEQLVGDCLPDYSVEMRAKAEQSTDDKLAQRLLYPGMLPPKMKR